MDIATMFYIIFSGILWGFGFLCLFLMSPVNDFFETLLILFERINQFMIPKEPEFFCDYSTGYEGFKCPSCHVFLGKKQAFCAECGQKILWKSEEELNE